MVRYLAYGSSITHGSLGLVQPDSYVFRIAQLLGTDYINLGFAGKALMEPEMAEYIVSRKDWNFATVEMGINAVEEQKGVTAEKFERLIYTDGLQIFNNPCFVSADLVHPSIQGQQQIAERWGRVIKEYTERSIRNGSFI